MIGVYFDTWACPWTSDPNKCALSSVTADKVFLAFCKPDTTYKKSQGTWDTTGLDFSIDFETIRKSIQILQSKGTKVILSVGGATYPFDTFNVSNVADLMYDLGCDGMDIDWEPQNPVQDADKLVTIIKQAKQYCGGGLTLSVAGFASGCMEPQSGDVYRGCMLGVLNQVGSLLDFINLMNYDGGKDWDYKDSYLTYKQNFSNPVYFGLEIGKQGWGDALLSLTDIQNASQYVASTDGYFIWAWFSNGNPNARQVIDYIKSFLPSPPAKPIPVPSKPNPVVVDDITLYCKNCGTGIVDIKIK